MARESLTLSSPLPCVRPQILAMGAARVEPLLTVIVALDGLDPIECRVRVGIDIGAYRAPIHQMGVQILPRLESLFGALHRFTPWWFLAIDLSFPPHPQ